MKGSSGRPAVWLLLTAVAAALLPSTVSRASEHAADGVPDELERQRGDYLVFPSFVFDNPSMKDAYFDYMKQFRVCLTNGYSVFEGDDLREVDEARCRLMVYRWFAGYYVEELHGVGYYGRYPEVYQGWQEIHRHPDWLLNHEAPIAGAGTSAAYFFDWANPGLRAFYIDYLIKRLDAIGYDGVFFDLTGDWALPEHVKRLWSVKHPHMTYNEAGAIFVQELREALGPDRLIFGNGVYRLDNAVDWYQHLSHDATESFGTAAVYGKDGAAYVEGKGLTNVAETYYRPWDGAAGYKQSMEWPGFGPVSKSSGTPVEFVLTDYIQAALEPTGASAVVDGVPVPVYRRVPDRAAIHYGYALGKLYNLTAFASDWPSWNGDPTSVPQDDVYRADLRAPLEPRYRELDGFVVRYFERGFVVVTRTNDHNNQTTPFPGPTGSGAPVVFQPDPAMAPSTATGLWDAYESAPVGDWTPSNPAVQITPKLYPISGSHYPSGRLYLYTGAAP